MSASTRTGKLFATLTARERALLALQAWKDGGDEDRQVRATTPPTQINDFNHFIALMNSTNESLGRYLVVLRAYVEQLGLIDGWLSTIKLWGLNSFEIGAFIFRRVPEPVLATEYERRKRISRKRNIRPDRAMEYAVFPDQEAADVERIAGEREHVMEVLVGAPFGPFIDVDERPPQMELAYQALVDRLHRQVPDYWRQLRAAEMLIGLAAEELGEDPALPEVRAIVVWLREELTALHAKLSSEYLRETALSEPSDEDLETIRQIARWPLDSPHRTVLVSVHD